MEKSEDIKDLLAALSKAQAIMKVAVKDKINPHYKSKYASPESVQDATKEALAQNGLSVLQLIEEDNGTHLRTILGHSSGQWIASHFKLSVTRQDMQGLGSAITYARRYAVSAILNVASDEDDDANMAVQKQSPFPDEWPEPPKASMTAKVNKPKPQNLAPAGPAEKALFDDRSPLAVADDMKRDLEKYKIPFGKKYMGKTLFDIGIHNAKEYLAWLLKQAEMKGSQPPENVAKLKDMVQLFEYYLLEQQNAKAVVQTPGFDPSEPWPEERQ